MVSCLALGSHLGARKRTHCRWVLAEVTGLVSLEEALWLDVGGGATGKSLVEGDDLLHADGILCCANGLWVTQVSPVFLYNHIPVVLVRDQGARSRGDAYRAYGVVPMEASLA